MPSSTLGIAIAQCRSQVGRIDENLQTVATLCARAQARGASLILFPETHATGYSYHHLPRLVQRTAQPIDGPICSELKRLAKRHELVICCGFFERDEQRIFNAHAVAFPDGRLQLQRKGILNEQERKVLHPWRRRRLFVWRDLRFAILVCADSALPQVTAKLRRHQPHLVLHPSAGCFTDQLPTRQDDLRILRHARACARDWGSAYATANPVGFSGEDWYGGNSWVMDHRGRVLAHLPTPSHHRQLRDSLTLGFLTPRSA